MNILCKGGEGYNILYRAGKLKYYDLIDVAFYNEGTCKLDGIHSIKDAFGCNDEFVLDLAKKGIISSEYCHY
jgi:hypothetical protein